MTIIPDGWLSYLRSEFGLELDEKQAGSFLVLLDELAEWNARFNLVSYRTAEEVFWRHFADSLAAVPAAGGLLSPCSAVDIGAGAGFPGLPVKIARPGVSLTFAESIMKKCSFIEHAAGKLGLEGAEVFNGRAEVLGRDTKTREKYDITFSRAVSALSPNLETALPLLKTGGRALIHKSETSAGELDSAGTALKTLGGEYESSFNYRLPGYERGHVILVFRKVSATPEKYPRRPGMSEKKPL